jgi:hypothetical protein
MSTPIARPLGPTQACGEQQVRTGATSDVEHDGTFRNPLDRVRIADAGERRGDAGGQRRERRGVVAQAFDGI